MREYSLSITSVNTISSTEKAALNGQFLATRNWF